MENSFQRLDTDGRPGAEDLLPPLLLDFNLKRSRLILIKPRRFPRGVESLLDRILNEFWTI